jgi:hypothetical protein
MSQAEGDLNGDGRADAALIATFTDPKRDEQLCRLVIAFRESNNTFKVATTSDTAVMCSCGPSSGMPVVHIKKGVLTVSHYCGSRERYEFFHKYAWRDGKLLLIGFTANTNDTLRLDQSQGVDINFVTGEVETQLLNGKDKRNERFLEIRAPRITAAQPGVTDWAVPRIVLRPLKPGSSAIATQAVYNNEKLFIRVQFDPPSKQAPFKANLVTAAGKAITPLSSETSPYGYLLLTYSLAAPDVKAAMQKVTDWSSEDPHRVLRLSLNVQPDKNSPASISTARSAPGAILLSRSHEPLTLKDIDVREGTLAHPFVYKY